MEGLPNLINLAKTWAGEAKVDEREKDHSRRRRGKILTGCLEKKVQGEKRKKG